MDQGKITNMWGAKIKLERVLCSVAVLIAGSALVGCWESDVLLRSESELIDPFGQNFQSVFNAEGPREYFEKVTFTPDGKWFKLKSNTDRHALLAFALGDYAPREKDIYYLTVVSDSHKESERYTYQVGRLHTNPLKLEICGLAKAYKVDSRKALVDEMRKAVLKDKEENGTHLRCNVFTNFKFGAASDIPTDLDEKQALLRGMERDGLTSEKATKSPMASVFVTSTGPIIECNGHYLGKMGFPDKEGDYLKLMVIYFGDHIENTPHGPDFEACGETMLQSRDLVFGMQTLPYRLIAMDKNYTVFLDSRVQEGAKLRSPSP